ncbi:hypothetical protein GWI33_013421 [Rhynchophorus ferrugineus]|uniref:Uncharacterized protein n=1 Tax=Rhynchophorus ferrugineus TaxID=354439 RepID=A0A834I3S5_RHYFE|nr:hypothetical protein GWI33_013421 [Rhynchophorus ferrugineus]
MRVERRHSDESHFSLFFHEAELEATELILTTTCLLAVRSALSGPHPLFDEEIGDAKSKFDLSTGSLRQKKHDFAVPPSDNTKPKNRQ